MNSLHIFLLFKVLYEIIIVQHLILIKLLNLRYHFIPIRHSLSDNRFQICHSKSSLSLAFVMTTSGIPVLDIIVLLNLSPHFSDIQIVD